jgi:hypothetical protein
LFGPGIKKPGDVVQTVYSTTTTPTTVANNVNTATALVGTITPTSAVNLVKVQAVGRALATTATSGVELMAQIYRTSGSTALGNISTLGGAVAGNLSGPVICFVLDSPGSASSTQYGVYIKDSTGTVSWAFLGTANSVGTNTGVMTIEEIMG